MATKYVSSTKNAGYDIVKGQRLYGIFTFDKASNTTTFVKYGRYIAVEKIYKCDGVCYVTIGFDEVDGSTGHITVERSALSSRSNLQELLLNAGADAPSSSMSVLRDCLAVSERLIAKVNQGHRFTGWVKDSEPLVFRTLWRLTSNGEDRSSPYCGNYDLTTGGTFAGWRKMVRAQVIGYIPMEVVLLTALSPLVSSLVGARNLIFHLMGDSSKGKTTAGVLAVSVYGCPDPKEASSHQNIWGQTLRPLLSSWSATANAQRSKPQGLDGTILVLDELSKCQFSKELADILYSYSDGGEKDRKKDSKTLEDVVTFRTNILSLGEESLISKAENGNTGLRMRIFEIRADFTKDAEHSEAIVEGCYANYGFAAPFVAQKMIDLGLSEIKQMYKDNLKAYTAALREAGDRSTSTKRLAEFGAVLLTTAQIAAPALGLTFSVEKIQEFLLEQQTSTEENQSLGERAHEALWGYINQHIANFTLDNNFNWTKSIECLGHLENAKDGVGKEASFEKSVFAKIMKELGFNNSKAVIDSFKNLGYLNHETNKSDRKRTITSQGGTVRVYAVIFPDAV